MVPFSKLLLEIYRSAREMPIDVFQGFLLRMVGSLVPFDSSRWVTVELFGRQATTHNVHLINEPTDIVLDWDAINRQDRLLHAVTDNPGTAFSIHSESEYRGREYAAIRNYARRYRHSNVLCIAQFNDRPNHVEGISLFRAASDNHFDDSHRVVLEQLMPHIVEAVISNRLLNLSRGEIIVPVQERGAVAIVGVDGSLHFASGEFRKLLHSEWPGWTGMKVPPPLLRLLAKTGTPGYLGNAITVTVRHADGLLFLRARRRNPLDLLSPREATVARLYGAGSSYKDIARHLDVTPTTVRNFLQRIYAKLGIRDKAQLATIVTRADD